MIDIVNRLKFDATRCELQFSRGVASNIGDGVAEIERLRAERDQFERDAGRLRLAAYEATTNGRWTEGEQCGEWAISHEVYETLRDALADEQLGNSDAERS